MSDNRAERARILRTRRSVSRLSNGVGSITRRAGRMNENSNSLINMSSSINRTPTVSMDWRNGESGGYIEPPLAIGSRGGPTHHLSPVDLSPLSDITNMEHILGVSSHLTQPSTQSPRSCLTQRNTPLTGDFIQFECGESSVRPHRNDKRRRVTNDGWRGGRAIQVFSNDDDMDGHRQLSGTYDDDDDGRMIVQDNSNLHERMVSQKEDFGAPDHVCPNPHCRAIVWGLERSLRSKSPRNPTFSVCCMNGKIQLPMEIEPPDYLKELMDYKSGGKSSYFRRNIREFNCRFSFTSTGGQIDNTINDGTGPYVFRMKGENHHRIGSLVPPEGQRPRFAQLYIYDTENEVHNRLASFGSGDHTQTDVDVIEGLTQMFNDHNQVVHQFRCARDIHRESDVLPVKIRLLSSRSGDGRRYNLPSSSEIAALTVGLDEEDGCSRDIVVFDREHGAQRIQVDHPKLMALHFPVLIPFGEDGYRQGIEQRQGMGNAVRKNVTMCEYYAFKLHNRADVYSTILRGGRLFQQYVVYAYCCILEERFSFLRRNQDKFRCEVLNGLQDAVARGDSDATRSGRPCILPSSFTGGPRYMIQAYQDAMAICRWNGHPELFITMTCNPKWNEITRFLELIPGQTPEDRPDVISRVFEMKLHSLLLDVTKKMIFGNCIGVVVTIEFQKRGLPHAHIAVFLHPSDKLKDTNCIDRHISAELPNPDTDPIAFKAVSTHMMHGPCGNAHLRSPCMMDNKCSKRYPKKLQMETTVAEDGYPIYRRRPSGHTVVRKGTTLDNGWVVHHNVDLVVKHDCHVCVEKTNRDMCVKYLCKYMHKGSDRSTVIITSDRGASQASGRTSVQQIDELKQYMDCRYISASEACWRIFGYFIHKHEPAVDRLSFHLPNEQSIVFNSTSNLNDVVQTHAESVTKFLGWMECNRTDPDARVLTYVEFPSRYVWNRQTKRWSPRKSGKTVGRLYFVHPTAGERYYLRLLLNVVRGPTSFDDIRTINGVLHPTYRDACMALGLLEDDGEWHEAIREASHWAMGPSLRELFVTILTLCQVSDPIALWMNNKELLSEDVLFNQRRIRGNHDLLLSDGEIFNCGLYEIEKLLNRLGRSLKDYEGMPFPDLSSMVLEDNSLIFEELNYDREELKEEHRTLFNGLNAEQLNVYNSIIRSSQSGNGGFFFVYGSGGTGKTYVWRTVLAKIRSEGKIALAVASSGIAALLLPGGKTAHSRFKIPIEIDKDSLLNVKQSTPLADLICRASVIIWDEAPMAHRYTFEAMDRSFRDLMRTQIPGSSDIIFGGKTIVLGGDFRQILPVIPRGTRGDVVAATICSSRLWCHCRIHVLSENMRVQNSSFGNAALFSDWLIKLGEGKLPLYKFSDEEEDNTWLKVPEAYLVHIDGNGLDTVIDETYPDLCNRVSDRHYLRERAILNPQNETVDIINTRIMARIDGETISYLSADRVSPTSENVDEQVELYPVEYLNTLKFSGLPNHELLLKVGVPIIMMRNMNHANGLCNGTRMVVTKLSQRVIEAEILSGCFIGRRCLIPRVEMVPLDTKLPFKLSRRQFPVKVCFAMTINKSQGQIFNRVGLYLPQPVFSHGQLYVAASRVTSPDGFKVIIESDNPCKSEFTKNVVYTEIFDRLYT